MRDGYLKVGAVSPVVSVAGVSANVERTVKAIRMAEDKGIKVLVLPELGLTGYTLGDLVFSQDLLAAARDGLAKVASSTAHNDVLAVVGLPYAHKGKLYNVAALVHHGSVLAIIPKTNIPSYGEFYEGRWFSPSPEGVDQTLFEGKAVPFGADIPEPRDTAAVHKQVYPAVAIPVRETYFPSAGLSGVTVFARDFKVLIFRVLAQVFLLSFQAVAFRLGGRGNTGINVTFLFHILTSFGCSLSHGSPCMINISESGIPANSQDAQSFSLKTMRNAQNHRKCQKAHSGIVGGRQYKKPTAQRTADNKGFLSLILIWNPCFF